MWISSDICLKFSLNSVGLTTVSGEGYKEVKVIEAYGLRDRTKLLKQMPWNAFSLLLLSQPLVGSTCEV